MRLCVDCIGVAMITFPKADVIPFGEHGDKLGMTRSEMLQMMETYTRISAMRWSYF